MTKVKIKYFKKWVRDRSEYNETNAAMDLVLFEDAMKHIARIVRIILNSSGHALLVGVGGSGKQSLTKLASFICTYTVYQIQISSTYSMSDFKEDLKIMHNKAGIKEEGVTFLLTDSQITNERFLIFVNDLLASGDVPDLFAADEATPVFIVEIFGGFLFFRERLTERKCFVFELFSIRCPGL